MSEIKIVHGDCVEKLRDIQSDSVDFILTDLPFNVNLNYNSIDDNLPDEEYSKWCEKWLVELYRILKDNHYCIIFTGDSKLYWVMKAIYNGNFIYHHFIKWRKDNCQRALSGTVFFNRVELAFLLSKGKPDTKLINRKILYQDTIRVKNTTNNDKDAVDHPARRPVELYTQLIEGFTKEGDLVIDPFSGSGSSAIAAYQTGRDYIGIEIDKKYIDIINKRLEDTEVSLI